MAAVNQIEIRCQHCDRWFPSPILVGDDESFDTNTLADETVTCPHCGRPTGCDADHTRFSAEGGRSS